MSEKAFITALGAMIAAFTFSVASPASALPAGATVYCKTVGVRQGCVVRSGDVVRRVRVARRVARRTTRRVVRRSPINRGVPVNRVGRL